MSDDESLASFIENDDKHAQTNPMDVANADPRERIQAIIQLTEEICKNSANKINATDAQFCIDAFNRLASELRVLVQMSTTSWTTPGALEILKHVHSIRDARVLVAEKNAYKIAAFHCDVCQVEEKWCTMALDFVGDLNFNLADFMPLREVTIDSLQKTANEYFDTYDNASQTLENTQPGSFANVDFGRFYAGNTCLRKLVIHYQLLNFIPELFYTMRAHVAESADDSVLYENETTVSQLGETLINNTLKKLEQLRAAVGSATPPLLRIYTDAALWVLLDQCRVSAAHTSEEMFVKLKKHKQKTLRMASSGDTRQFETNSSDEGSDGAESDEYSDNSQVEKRKDKGKQKRVQKPTNPARPTRVTRFGKVSGRAAATSAHTGRQTRSAAASSGTRKPNPHVVQPDSDSEDEPISAPPKRKRRVIADEEEQITNDAEMARRLEADENLQFPEEDSDEYLFNEPRPPPPPRPPRPPVPPLPPPPPPPAPPSQPSQPSQPSPPPERPPHLAQKQATPDAANLAWKLRRDHTLSSVRATLLALNSLQSKMIVEDKMDESAVLTAAIMTISELQKKNANLRNGDPADPA